MTRIKVYADTNVYIDIFEGRKNKYEDWGEFALNFLRRVKDKEYKLVVYDWVFDEIKKVKGTDKELHDLLKTFKEDDVIFIQRTRDDEKEAFRISKTNYPDALHVILAKKHDCVYLVTRNLDDFMEFRDIIEIILPRSL